MKHSIGFALATLVIAMLACSMPATLPMIIATATPAVTPTPKPMWGPVDGTLQRNEEYCADVGLINFVAEAAFVNPSAEPETGNAGYGFKYYRSYPDALLLEHPEVEYETWVNWANGDTEHHSQYKTYDGTSVSAIHGLDDFQYQAVRAGPGENNLLRLVVNGNIAQLHVNGTPGPKVDLTEEGVISGLNRPGQICICLCNFAEAVPELGISIQVREVNFSDFSVWPLP
jgi:hypothetical protein